MQGESGQPGAAGPSRWRRLLRGMLLAVVLVPAGLIVGGQMGLFAGSRPDGLGVHDGRLKAAPATPNCVNSQSTEGYSKIAPLAFAGDGKAAMARLSALVASMPGARTIKAGSDYLYAEFSSKWLGFVDDVEFQLDAGAGVIHVRSASRLGHGDLGVNRQRIESIRTRHGGQ